MIVRSHLTLPPYPRGLHLITGVIEKELNHFQNLPQEGLVHLFLLHTSAGLIITENFDRDVPADLNHFMNRLAPDSESLYRHSSEGADDMPAHIKSAVTGVSLTIPFASGRLLMGTWQGIFLCEFRDQPSVRKIIVTIYY